MFGQALKAALTAVSKDSSLPIINHVKVCPGAVYATDRYRLVRSRYHLHADYENYPFNDTGTNNNLTDFEPFLLPADIAKTLIKLDLKNVTHNTDSNTVILTLFDPKTPHLEQSFTLYDTVETSFPDLEKLLSDAEKAFEENIKIPALQDNQVVFNHEFLAAWPKRVLYRPKQDNRSSNNMTVRFTAPNKPVLFSFSDHFTGLLMPIRF